MGSQLRNRLGLLMAVFALSGFAGLIYQSIWSQYLGLTLGHAAYAQTLVLAIYMGGLAIGSWWVSRRIHAIGNPLLAYAAVELLIGLFGLGFHTFFKAYSRVSQESILAQFTTVDVHLYLWVSGALLILPQCILLGTTFPLMTAACLRLRRDALGWSLGGLYFTNSLGAALGALVATFLLLPKVGLPGAMAVAGVLNAIVAILAWTVAHQMASALSLPAVTSDAEANDPIAESKILKKRLIAIVLIAAGVTGATSFVCEIVWVRMLNLALGTTLHTFELMLATFILGLAAGAYWIHRRGDRIANTLGTAGVVQVMMGVASLVSILTFNQSFRWVAWMVSNFPHDDSGYSLFNLGCAAVAMLVMFPTAFFAGTTLPLFTLSLLRAGQGEKSVGWVYAANTVGAIVGVVLVVHLMIPIVGLNLSLIAASAMDMVLGLALLLLYSPATGQRDSKRLGLAASAALLGVLLFGRTDPIMQSSGVFRSGGFLDSSAVHLMYLSDGQTATVSVLKSASRNDAAIITNGKPDASMALSVADPPIDDEVTMIMAAALPLALHPAPRDVAVIGWGSGLTTHTMLGSKQVRLIDTVEIEPKMYEGAKSFGARVTRAYTDPRSHVIFDDARTYFSAGRKHYDVIFSEPSNPWVSGVASLFTEEFYFFLRRHLNPGGLFVQWLQSYEISDPLQAQIVAAFMKAFPDCEIYQTNSADLILVASNGPRGALDMSRLRGPQLTPELQRVGLGNVEAFNIRRIGGADVLGAYVRMEGATGHSDYYPVVALGAPKSRYLRQNADLLATLVSNGMPVLDVIANRSPIRRSELDAYDSSSTFVKFELLAGLVTDALASPDAMPTLKSQVPDIARRAGHLLELSKGQVDAGKLSVWSDDLAIVARYSLGGLPAENLDAAWVHPSWLAAGQSPEVNAIMAAYRAAALRDPPSMRAQATAVLALEPALLSDTLRQQMLVIAMTGAAGQGDFAEVRRLDAAYGPRTGRADESTRVRRFLLAWVDRRLADHHGPTRAGMAR